jgi:N-acetylneuraminic acid mutarotase
VINRSAPGVFNFTIEYNNSNGELGTPDMVIVTVTDEIPISNSPSDILTSTLGTETIDWILSDDWGSGQYRVWANDTSDNYYVWVDWSVWINNTNLAITINRTILGVFNFTIEYNDSNSQLGTPDTVIVTVIEPSNVWTWISGNYSLDQTGNYGTKGVADGNNIPGSRGRGYTWTDSDDNLWLFGGYGYNDSTTGRLNDLWKFDGVNWTWVSGSQSHTQIGNYGVQGVADENNIPGVRYDGNSWIDSNGTFWLFGGRGYANDTSDGVLNDLWKFDGTNWTWVSGNNERDQVGIYGTKGVADSNNVPGGRSRHFSWIDSDDNLWLFGGYGYNDTTTGRLNDLWKFDGVNWTWVSGSKSHTQIGTYGVQGVADENNIPGVRYEGNSWKDSNDTFWLFGGRGYANDTSDGRLNDLWKYDGTNWTWVSGGNERDQLGQYGTKGVADSNNVPGGRYQNVAWIDLDDNLWLFSGYARNNESDSGRINDLWKFNQVNWTWVSGSYEPNQYGDYGTKGVADVNNIPGARYRALYWVDSESNFYVFGGHGYNDVAGTGNLIDLWKYKP